MQPFGQKHKQHHRQVRQTDQTDTVPDNDCIGQTILQTVAQKLKLEILKPGKMMIF